MISADQLVSVLFIMLSFSVTDLDSKLAILESGRLHDGATAGTLRFAVVIWQNVTSLNI